jgi:sensor histidine kinase regulating citrate/malate metabolism
LLKEIVQIEDYSEELVPVSTDHEVITAKNLVSMLGGRIWVEHKQGSGNLFTILLPILEDRIPAEAK